MSCEAYFCRDDQLELSFQINKNNRELESSVNDRTTED